METPNPSSRVPLQRRVSVVSALVCAGTLALLAGCAGHRPRQGPPEQPQPPLAAKAEFLSGALVAEARVTSFRHNLPRPDHDGGGKNEGGHSGPPPGGGGGMGHGGGGMGGGGPGGGMGGGPGAGGPPPGGGDSGSNRPHGGAGLGAIPRQTLHISFTNSGTTPVTISITELNSLIGNFAPQPEKLTIAPGATASLLPVSGDAGGLLNWLDVTLALRSNTGPETKVLHLIPTGEPAESASPPPPDKH